LQEMRTFSNPLNWRENLLVTYEKAAITWNLEDIDHAWKGLREEGLAEAG